MNNLVRRLFQYAFVYSPIRHDWWRVLIARLVFIVLVWLAMVTILLTLIAMNR